MTVSFEWKYNSSVVREPFASTEASTYSFVLKNTGDTTAYNVGFYLVPSTHEGDVDNPSTSGILADWYDALTKGAIGGSPPKGFSITQSAVTTPFKFGQGDTVENKIDLSIGSGGNNDQLAPGEEVTLQFTYVKAVGDPARRLYIEVAVYHETE